PCAPRQSPRLPRSRRSPSRQIPRANSPPSWRPSDAASNRSSTSPSPTQPHRPAPAIVQYLSKFLSYSFLQRRYAITSLRVPHLFHLCQQIIYTLFNKINRHRTANMHFVHLAVTVNKDRRR